MVWVAILGVVFFVFPSSPRFFLFFFFFLLSGEASIPIIRPPALRASVAGVGPAERTNEAPLSRAARASSE